MGWKLYARHFGTPRIRGDVWAGIIAHASAAPHIKKRLSVKDFFPSWGRPPVTRQTSATMKRQAERWAMAAKKVT